MKKETKNLITKQPVVVLVGHIDHGKTSILDFIRKTHMAEKETGGITQHIGAYEVAVPVEQTVSSRGQEAEGSHSIKKEILRPSQDDFAARSRKITFIDTPGHEAFSAMRARGAKVADIAILVVASDEGVQPQTKEAISHIKKANVSMIVAINKVDKPGSQPERVKDGLSQNDVLVEARAGKIPCVEVSAKTGKGIPELLDLILLVAEMEGLKADIEKTAEGVIIESRLDNKRGATATLLSESGVLREGDIIATFSAVGKIKRLENFLGKQIKEIIPGQPALVLGFEQVPIMGERFSVFQTLEQAKQNIKVKEAEEMTVLNIEPDRKVLNLILKADVLGSIEPIKNVLKSLPQEKIILRILKEGVGDVNLSDIKLAEAGKAIILGFRVKTPTLISEVSQQKGIKIFNFDLIYDLVEGLRNFMQKSMASEVVRIDLGKLKTLLVFRTEKKRQIVGARVLEGEIRKGVRLEIYRDGEEEENKIGEGKIIELQKNKKEIGKGEKGEEVGILYEGEAKIQEGDILKVYEKQKQKVEL